MSFLGLSEMELVKVIHTVLLFTFSFSPSECHGISWTWIKGSNMADMVESETSPGGRSGAAYWVQQDKKAVWLFGGEYHQDHDKPGLENDLWKLDLTSLQWTLIHNGSAENRSLIPESRQLASACGITNTYFILYGGLNEKEEALSDTWLYYIPDGKWYGLTEIRLKLVFQNEGDMKHPDAKGDQVTWCHNNSLYLFGGFDIENNLSHELWVFDLVQLSWKQAESSRRLPKDGTFIKYLQYPMGRSGATKWSVNDELFMFGGNVLDKNVRSKHLVIGNSADLWKYSISGDNWTHIMGRQEPCKQVATYGTLGKTSPSSYPSCRRQAVSWVDQNKNLWMYGGDGVDNSPASLSVFTHSKLLSDLWYFDVEYLLWTWKGGSEAGDFKGNFGNLGESSETTTPGSRCETVVWSVGSIFYLFGGVGHDANGMDGYLSDIWKLDIGSDPVLLRNAPGPGQVFGVIFFGLALVAILSIVFVLLRGSFTGHHDEQVKGEYTRIEIGETEQ